MQFQYFKDKNWLNKKLLTIIIALFFLTQLTQAQIEIAPKMSFKERVFWGGNIGFQFGNRTVINLNPLLGYKINQELSAGLGINYLYYNDKTYAYSDQIIGSKIFSRYQLFDFLFLHAEYEVMNLTIFDVFRQRKRTTIDALLVGGGYSQQLSQKASLNLMALWNVKPNLYYPYNNPILRFGVNFGL